MGGGGKRKSRPLYQSQPEMYGKVKWMATSERVNLFFIKTVSAVFEIFRKYQVKKSTNTFPMHTITKTSSYKVKRFKFLKIWIIMVLFKDKRNRERRMEFLVYRLTNILDINGAVGSFRSISHIHLRQRPDW